MISIPACFLRDDFIRAGAVKACERVLVVCALAACDPVYSDNENFLPIQ
jgi:hypothetical protein